MKILLAGGYDTQNLGDYASFAGLNKLLSKHELQPSYTVLTRHTDDPFTEEFSVKPILNLDHTNKAASQGRIFNGFNEGDDSVHLHDICQSMYEADLLLLGNGRLFIDISLGFMKGPLAYFHQLVCLAKYLNKPVVLYSVTLVEPATDEGKKILSFILQNADKIIVREPYSVSIAKKYTRNHKKIVCLPDIAFALDSDDADDKLPISIPSEAIGLNFRGVNYDTISGKESLKAMVSEVKRILEWTPHLIFCQQCNYDVDTRITDDRHIHSLIYEALPHSLRSQCTLYENKLTMAQTLGLYQKLKHLYTTRRHGFIMSLTQNSLASLICEEENTSVVQESIPTSQLFLYGNTTIPNELPDASLLAEIKNHIQNIREQLAQYPSELLGVLR